MDINKYKQYLVSRAFINAFKKLLPNFQLRNPVMFSVYLGAILISIIYFTHVESSDFILAMSLSLWFTIFFANFAESLAEYHGKAHANSLKKSRRTVLAKKINHLAKDAKHTVISADKLKAGDFVLVEEADIIPSDGEVMLGIASVNESAITGESAPVIREANSDRNLVTGGTLVISDWLIIKITVNPGETFLDRMIQLVEGAKREKTPNELALTILLSALTIIFLVVSATVLPISMYSRPAIEYNTTTSIAILIALFACLAPTTIGGLISAISISGTDRMLKANILAISGQAIEAAGNVDVLLLDKTGTITLGDRKAIDFVIAENINIRELADAAMISSMADETPEGRSIVKLARQKYSIKLPDLSRLNATFIPYTAESKMSGANIAERQIRKGAAHVIEEYIKNQGGVYPDDVRQKVVAISKQGGTALVVAEGNKILGVVHLKDIIKGGTKERFQKLRQMGIKTIMLTGDNPITAATIAAEAGVDDFFANASPEQKLDLIKLLQQQGNLVAMAGDGTNDAPALAQADVALVMSTGTQAAKEAGNLIDLDSNPTKLLEVVAIGKQLLMTRGAITTFSIASDIAKYFAILPAAFSSAYPVLESLNVMRLASPQSAILSAIVFNALNIVLLIPLSIRGVKYREEPASVLLKKNLLTYALGGLLIPFAGIKLIDILISGVI